MTHTWQQQQQIEREFVERTRREWAQALVDKHKSVAAAARAGGIDRAAFNKIIRRLDVSTPPVEQYVKAREREAEARVLASKGYTLREAAAALGINTPAVKAIEDKIGVEFRRVEKNARAREREAKARALAAEGYTLKQAAESLGMTISGVIRIENRIGIEFRRENRAGQQKPKAPTVPDRPMTMADYARMESERMRINNRGGL